MAEAPAARFAENRTKRPRAEPGEAATPTRPCRDCAELSVGIRSLPFLHPRILGRDRAKANYTERCRCSHVEQLRPPLRRVMLFPVHPPQEAHVKTGKAVSIGFALIALFAGTSVADPLPGESLLFSQQPMLHTNIFGPVFFGHDEASTAVQLPVGAPFDVYAGPFMADDFAFKSGQAITHLKFWGGYLSNLSGENVQKFFISFESD